MLIAVLDACTLYPAVLRETLLRTAEAGLFELRCSDRILHEATATLMSHGRMQAADKEALVARLRTLGPHTVVPTGPEPPTPLTNDPKDRHVLATAIASQARVIVTANLKDFPPPSLAPHGVIAQLPAQFLVDRFNADPPAMLATLQAQAEAGAMALSMLLDRLQTTAPRLARTVKRHLVEATGMTGDGEQL